MVEYKKGAENKVADVISPRSEANENEELEGSCRMVLAVEKSWLVEVRKMVDQSPFF